MVPSKVGRNDPCPCGSGRKYKHCCLREDQGRRRTREPSSPRKDRQSEALSSGRLSSRGPLTALSGHSEPGFEEELESIGRIAAYVARQDEIRAAIDTLKPYGDQFEAMLADAPALMKRAFDLFSQDRFRAFRFTPTELERAFDAVGYPAPDPQGLEDEDLAILLDAAIYLAGDAEERSHTALRVMQTLPEIVAEGRFMDGWLIQHSVARLTEDLEQNNPFTFIMVLVSMEAWERAMAAKQRAIAQELGIDVESLGTASEEDTSALVRELQQDALRRARLQRFLDDEPALHRQAAERIRRQESRALRLLERADAGRLFLSLEEMEPWLTVFVNRAEGLLVKGELPEGEDQLDSDPVEALNRIVHELTLEMSSAIFTPERVDQLKTDLQDYRRRLLEAEEQEAVRSAESALAIARWEVPPEDNPLLLGICFASLREVFRALGEIDASERY